MGLKQTELVPISSLGPTPLIPGSKTDLSKFFQISRADTTLTLKCALGGSASLAAITIYGGVNSDAATAATLVISVSNNLGVVSTGTVDVKAAGNTTALVQMSNLPLLEQLPPNGDYRISVTYAETGAASTVGGPWKIRVMYV